MKAKIKKIGEVLGLIYGLSMLAFSFVFLYVRWNTVDGFFAHWELIPSCAWQAGLWPFFVTAYFP